MNIMKSFHSYFVHYIIRNVQEINTPYFYIILWTTLPYIIAICKTPQNYRYSSLYRYEWTVLNLSEIALFCFTSNNSGGFNILFVNYVTVNYVTTKIAKYLILHPSADFFGGNTHRYWLLINMVYLERFGSHLELIHQIRVTQKNNFSQYPFCIRSNWLNL